VPDTDPAPESVPAQEAFTLPEGFDLQGHRGARGLKPENTLPAFETGLDEGVTTLELDLHLSADDQIVVWHDPVIDPLKCGLAEGAPSDVPDPDDPEIPRFALAVRALSVEQLGWYRCDRNPDPARFPDQDASASPLAGDRYAIVTLEELFAFVERYAEDASKTGLQRAAARQVAFNIETKRKPDDPAAIGDGFNGSDAGPFEIAVLEIVAESGMDDRVIIQSFDPRSIRAIRAIDPDIPLAFLTSRGAVDFDAMVEGGANVWSPNADQVSEERVEDAHEAGLTVVPWTVNGFEEAAELISDGVDGLITDRPDLFIQR
jgi:glycerophosphoryl diester phosphodiesterase